MTDAAASSPEIPKVLADRIVRVPLAKILPHPKNPNRGDVAAIAESIRVHGYVDPIIVQQSTGYAISGNHRLLAAAEVGLEEVPVVYVDMDDDEALRYLLAANETAKRSIYDDEALASILTNFALDVDGLGLTGTGFTAETLDDLLVRTGGLADRETDFLRDLAQGAEKRGSMSDGTAPSEAVNFTLPMAEDDRAALLRALERERRARGLDTKTAALVAALVTDEDRRGRTA